jgi:hypothetical protein
MDFPEAAGHPHLVPGTPAGGWCAGLPPQSGEIMHTSTSVYRYLAAACLVAGPLVGALIRAIEPAAVPTESMAAYMADYAAQPQRTQLMLMLDAFVWLMLPASLIAASLAWRRASTLSLVGGVVSLVGWMGVVMLVAEDVLIAVAGQTTQDVTQAAQLVEAWSNNGVVIWYMLLFVVGHTIGTVLIAAALWRAAAIPRWVAALIGISMPLHFVAYMSAVRPLDLLAWGMLLVGFAVCGFELLQGAARTEHIDALQRRVALG